MQTDTMTDGMGDLDKTERKRLELKAADEAIRGTDEQRRWAMERRTDAEIIEILARAMGWTVGKNSSLWCEGELVATVEQSSYPHWNPLTDLNAIHEVEERLTKPQRTQYRDELLKTFIPGEMDGDDYWELRHASARTCAYALAEVLENK